MAISKEEYQMSKILRSVLLGSSSIAYPSPQYQYLYESLMRGVEFYLGDKTIIFISEKSYTRFTPSLVDVMLEDVMDFSQGYGFSGPKYYLNSP